MRFVLFVTPSADTGAGKSVSRRNARSPRIRETHLLAGPVHEILKVQQIMVRFFEEQQRLALECLQYFDGKSLVITRDGRRFKEDDEMIREFLSLGVAS